MKNKYTTKQRYLYFSNRINDKNLTVNQRLYAKKWCDGFIDSELGLFNTNHNRRILFQNIKNDKKLDKAVRNGYVAGAITHLRSDKKGDSTEWLREQEDYRVLKPFEADYVYGRISKKEYVKKMEEDFLETNLYKGCPKFIK